jgi:hypothetical protein
VRSNNNTRVRRSQSLFETRTHVPSATALPTIVRSSRQCTIIIIIMMMMMTLMMTMIKTKKKKERKKAIVLESEMRVTWPMNEQQPRAPRHTSFYANIKPASAMTTCIGIGRARRPSCPTPVLPVPRPWVRSPTCWRRGESSVATFTFRASSPTYCIYSGPPPYRTNYSGKSSPSNASIEWRLEPRDAFV